MEDTLFNQYLTFILSGELFALHIASVREILDTTAITRVPRMPVFMRGVINLRGRAVPVVDLRRRFGMVEAEDTVDTCIVIAEVELEGERIVVGLLVDSVQEVVELEAGTIEPAPRMGSAIRAEFIQGMGKSGDRFIIILDADRIFAEEELSALQDGTLSSAA